MDGPGAGASLVRRAGAAGCTVLPLCARGRTLERMLTPRGRNPFTVVGGFFGHVVGFVVVSLLAGVLLAGLVLPFAAGVGMAARDSAESFQDIEVRELEIRPLPGRTQMQAVDGSAIATFYQENREEVRLDQIAPVMQQALIAIEDRRFYEHGPVDLRSVLRAVMTNLEEGGVEEGASTLTMQYARNLLIQNAETPEEQAAARAPSAERKLDEIKYAIALEETYSKDEILLGYLNTVYFGNRSYGIETAARNYFSVSAAQLSLPQAAMLAGLVQSPVAGDPTRNMNLATDRRNEVLDAMAASGAVTPEEVEAAKATPIQLALATSANGCPSSAAPFFCDYAYRWLLQRPELGETVEERDALLQSGRLTVRTTMDPVAQGTSQAAISARIEATNPVVGAQAMVEPGTGKVLALATSRGFGESEDLSKTTVNYAVPQQYGESRGFQAGSTFKIFTLTAAMEQGVSLYTRFPGVQTAYDGFTECGSGRPYAEPYEPANSTSSSGNPTILEATARSVNSAFVGLEEQISQCTASEMAVRLGVQRADGNPLTTHPSFTLGVDEVAPLSMAEAVATLAARGNHCEPYPITEVLDRNGEVLLAPQPTCAQVLDPKWADAATFALQGVMAAGGTGAAVALDRPSAGKTGTTNSNVAVWFVGYTPNLASAVYVGNPDSSMYPLDNVTIGGRFYDTVFGSSLPGPIWQESMSAALVGKPVVAFNPPPQESLQGRPVQVPDVRGQSVDAAIDRLEAAGFSVSVAPNRYFSDYPRETVATTDPDPGAAVTAGSTITIYISGGPQGPPAVADPPGPGEPCPRGLICPPAPPDPA